MKFRHSHISGLGFYHHSTRKKDIECKWVYKTKSHIYGYIERNKARLMAEGFTQVEGINFFGTFTPFAKLIIVRLLLALTSSLDIYLHQLDVHNAFLHGELNEEVYMSLPKGIAPSYPNQVSKLLKSLYGLKQSCRQWFAKLSIVFLSNNFKQCPVDHSLIIHQYPNSFIALLIYVDDHLIVDNNVEIIQHIKSTLQDYFHIKDLCPLKYFLGLEVEMRKSGINICQRKYVLDILSSATC